MLKKRGFEVSFVHNLAEGRIAVQTVRPAILFLDNNLPDGSGLESAPMLKAQSPETRIIMISAFDGIQERTMAVERGIDFFLGKPFNKQTAYAAVDQVYPLGGQHCKEA